MSKSLPVNPAAGFGISPAQGVAYWALYSQRRQRRRRNALNAEPEIPEGAWLDENELVYRDDSDEAFTEEFPLS